MTERSQRIRVIFFSFGILEQGGGFENYLVTTTRGLADRYSDLEISIVTMGPEAVEKLQHVLSIYFMRKQDPKTIYREPLEAIRKKLGSIVYTRVPSLKILAEALKSCDIIYSKNEVLELAVLHRIGIKKLPPVVLGVHTPIYYPYTPSLSAKIHNILYTGIVYRQLLKGIDSIQVNNHDDVELVRTKLRFPNVKVIRQAFDMPAKKPTPTLHKGPLRLLFVGRLTEQKGIDILIEIAKNLHDTMPGLFSLRIAGTGDPLTVDQANQLAENIDEVTYLGHIPNDEVDKLYDWTDVTVIPSKYETLNKVAVETAIAQKIAVCSDIPGPREVIQHKVTGFLVQPNAASFVTQLVKLAAMKKEAPDKFQSLGKAAYAYVRDKFSADAAYEEMHTEFVNISRGTHWK